MRQILTTNVIFVFMQVGNNLLLLFKKKKRKGFKYKYISRYNDFQDTN